MRVAAADSTERSVRATRPTRDPDAGDRDTGSRRSLARRRLRSISTSSSEAAASAFSVGGGGCLCCFGDVSVSDGMNTPGRDGGAALARLRSSSDPEPSDETSESDEEDDAEGSESDSDSDALEGPALDGDDPAASLIPRTEATRLRTPAAIAAVAAVAAACALRRRTTASDEVPSGIAPGVRSRRSPTAASVRSTRCSSERSEGSRRWWKPSEGPRPSETTPRLGDAAGRDAHGRQQSSLLYLKLIHQLSLSYLVLF